MSDWMFDDGSATSLLSQDYGPGSPPPVWEEPMPQGAPSEDPLYTEDLPDGGEVDPIVVTGPGTQTGGGTSGGGDFNWETDTTWLDPNAPEDDLPCTPPPDGRRPANADMDEVRDLAKDVRREINELGGPGRRWEYGALIYQMPDGSLHRSDLYTSYDPDTIDATIEIPGGARVVAWVHSHPTMRHSEQGAMSEDDVEWRNGFVQGAGSAADPNMMMYVIDREHGDAMSEFGMEDGEGDPGVVVGPCGG